MRKIEKIIIHCSASGKKTTVEDIRRWHVQERGWTDIGYHFIITQDGIIHNGRPAYKVGAHCVGENSGSIGICLVGNHEFSEAQFGSLRILVGILDNMFGYLTKHAHNEFNNNKTCPNFNIEDVL